jgi:hypothetical protein
MIYAHLHVDLMIVLIVAFPEPFEVFKELSPLFDDMIMCLIAHLLDS